MPKRIIFHVDVNSAFLSWEAVYRLKHLGGTVDLRDIPSAVGGDMEKRHGIILAKSSPAKKYNIKTGETLHEAREKCPDLVLVPPHYNLYSKCSHALMDLLREYTPDVEQYSIDEAFLDMSGTSQLFGDPVNVAYEILNRVREELGFTVNIGVSTNKLLAKMASDFQKPDRVHTLFPEEVPTKMWVLPVSELFFVGCASFTKLRKLGITTIGDLAHADLGILRQHLKSHGEVIWNYANGFDTATVECVAPKNKGYGNSTTIAFDVCDASTASLVLLSLAESVGMRVRRDHVKIQVVTVGIKYYDLSYTSHQKILVNPTDITSHIHRAAVELFQQTWDGVTPIRHLGIHTGRVKDSDCARQLSLEDLVGSPFYDESAPAPEKLSRMDEMADTIRGRFGLDSLKRASFLSTLPVDHVSGGISREKENVDYSKEIVQ